MTVFDDAHEITKGMVTWEPNANLDYCQIVGSFISSMPIRANQEEQARIVLSYFQKITE